MPDNLCEAVRGWLRQSDRAELPAPPPPALAEHIAGCATCRGLLALTAAELVGMPAAATLACEQCQEQLDALIDCEGRRGPAAAARRYPHAWWHLWTCADCAEVYRLAAALARAEQAGALQPLPTPAARQARLPMPALQLPRAYLHAVFAPYAQLGTAWGPADDDIVFAEDEQAGYQITVSLRPSRQAGWALVVAITPALAGRAVVRCGELHATAPFDAHGAAVIAPIPPAVLTEPAGDALLITIEHDQPHD